MKEVALQKAIIGMSLCEFSFRSNNITLLNYKKIKG